MVSFVRKKDATTAIEQMNGQWLGSRYVIFFKAAPAWRCLLGITLENVVAFGLI